MLSIQTNVNSMNAQENLRMTNDFQARTISRLTSGYRINQSGDDAAGLAVANKFRSDIAELSQGVRNANDGLSTMQIIDGGLSNISKMLDRLKTLATQSASSGFEGNRATLNQEYTSLLSEIDRQAANVGLGDNAGTSSRYNKLLNIYIGGGGDTTSNSGVKVDLSASSDKVSSSSLGISGTNINGGWVIDAQSQTANLSTTTLLAGGGRTQDYTVRVAGQESVTATIRGGADGISAADAVKQLNNQINSVGVSAVIDGVTGKLQFVSDKAFTITAAAASGGSTGLSGAANTINDAMYRSDGLAAFVTVAGGPEKFEVSNSAGQKVSITLADGTDLDAALTTLNNNLNSIGVYAVENAGGGGISFMSESNFSVSDHTAAGVTGVYGGGTPSTTAPGVTTAKDTTAASAAITSIASAVSKLGIVQGKIGTAQNKLSYAIQLAQSQITNFSAAESRIRDADVAQEAANLTKAQVLSQASMAALAQANSAPQSVLSLLRG